MVEMECPDAESGRRIEIGTAVVDEESLRRVESVPRQQNTVYLLFGLHRMLLARYNLAVKVTVDGEAAQKGDELARHVGQHIQVIPGSLQALYQFFRGGDLLLHVDGRMQVSVALFIVAAVVGAQLLLNLPESERATVVLLPEQRHLRRGHEREEFDEFTAAFAGIACEHHSAKVEYYIAQFHIVVFLLFRKYPRSATPQLLQRSALVAFQPPAAEKVLHQHHRHAKQETRRMPRPTVQPEAPVVEYQAADYGLADIVREAHLAVWRNLQQRIVCRGLVEQQNHARHDDGHHRKVLPHVEHYAEAVLHARYVCSRRKYTEQRIHDDKTCYAGPEDTSPRLEVVALVIEEAFAADDYTQQEEEERLRHAAVLYGPQEIHGQAVAYAHYGHVKP